MRVHKARGGASYDVDQERQYNWWKSKPGRKLNGPTHQLTRTELEAFAQEQGLELSANATFAVERHA